MLYWRVLVAAEPYALRFIHAFLWYACIWSPDSNGTSKIPQTATSLSFRSLCPTDSFFPIQRCFQALFSPLITIVILDSSFSKNILLLLCTTFFNTKQDFIRFTIPSPEYRQMSFLVDSVWSWKPKTDLISSWLEKRDRTSNEEEYTWAISRMNLELRYIHCPQLKAICWFEFFQTSLKTTNYS